MKKGKSMRDTQREGFVGRGRCIARCRRAFRILPLPVGRRVVRRKRERTGVAREIAKILVRERNVSLTWWNEMRARARESRGKEKARELEEEKEGKTA